MSEFTSRNIPLPIQREVRQRCGFGCVVCGLPLYEYDHMTSWSECHEHVASEITLLCDMHHKEKTNKLLTSENVREHDRNPYNLRNGKSKPYTLHYSGDSCEVVMGSVGFQAPDNGFGSQIVPISIDGDPVLGFIMGDGHLLLNLVWFNEYNEKVLHIRNNQLLYSVSPWDISLVGQRLTIREASRKFLIEMKFEVPNRVVIERARLLRNGIEVLVDADGITINEEDGISGISNIGLQAPVGIALGPHPPNTPALIKNSHISRYKRDFARRDQWIARNYPETKK